MNTSLASRIDTPGRAETPPPHYWRRWSSDATAANATASATASAIPDANTAGSAGSDATSKAINVPPMNETPSSSTPSNSTPSSSAPVNSTPVADSLADAPYRVLVVEDDPTQALFAEGVLKGAGIQTQVAPTSDDVMPAMEQFLPDLVLMDLHMPGLSGTGLTTLIRDHAAFAHTPIVFLTGDPDPERQFEVLECGADDFLSKPIRPRHLIAAVQSRIKRARALQRQRFGDNGRHSTTGLFKREYLMQRISAALTTGSGQGVLFLEIQHAAALHDRYGYAGFEQLAIDIAHRLDRLLGACPSTRLNDNAFLVFVPTGGPNLEQLARELRDGIGHATFDMQGMPLKLRMVVGYSTLEHGFADAGAALDAVEQATRAARSESAGLAPYTPPERIDANGDLVDAMRAGLLSGAFELQFQPVVAVAGGDEAQFQALLRMRNADGSVHKASELVPAAEAAGLMPDIDRWVLEQAIDLLHKRKGEQRPVRLFVSQSPHTLARDTHAGWLLEMLDSHAIDGPTLIIDLRLEDALVHTVALRQFCDALMPAGVQFCLSQYAHGDEADALLSQLPLGYMRLAPRYSNAHADSALRDQLRTAVDRAHRLGLQVIGPQVEDPQGAATLWMSGIDYIQGNLVQQATDEIDFDFQHSVL